MANTPSNTTSSSNEHHLVPNGTQPTKFPCDPQNAHASKGMPSRQHREDSFDPLASSPPSPPSCTPSPDYIKTLTRPSVSRTILAHLKTFSATLYAFANHFLDTNNSHITFPHAPSKPFLPAKFLALQSKLATFLAKRDEYFANKIFDVRACEFDAKIVGAVVEIEILLSIVGTAVRKEGWRGSAGARSVEWPVLLGVGAEERKRIEERMKRIVEDRATARRNAEVEGEVGVGRVLEKSREGEEKFLEMVRAQYEWRDVGV